MKRRELSDAAWAKLAPLLPPQKPRTGRPARDHRTIVNALLCFAKTGAPWPDLPERYGAWRSVATRFCRWTRSGVWQRVLAAVQHDADRRGELDWSLHLVEGTSVRAHRHAAGAKGGSRARPSGARAAASPATSTSAATARAGRSSSR